MIAEVNVLNNAGGRIDSGAIRSIIVLDSIATVGTVIIVHHTGRVVLSDILLVIQAEGNDIHVDCGLTHSTDNEIKDKLRTKAPGSEEEIEEMEFGEIME